MSEQPTVSFGLTQEEALTYRMMCRDFDLDPEEHLQVRKFTLTPQHWAVMTVVCANWSADEWRRQMEEHDDALAVPQSELQEIIDRFMKKCARKLNEADLHEEAEEWHETIEHLGLMDPDAVVDEIPEVLLYDYDG